MRSETTWWMKNSVDSDESPVDSPRGSTDVEVDQGLPGPIRVRLTSFDEKLHEPTNTSHLCVS